MAQTNLEPKLSLKIGSVNKAFFCFDIDYSLNQILLRNKSFLFYKIESWNCWKTVSWNLTKFKLNQTIDRKNRNNNCLNELKFCDVSQNSFSNWCWNFHHSILKKKSLIPKKIFFKPSSISKQRSFVYWPNFQWWFWRSLLVDVICPLIGIVSMYLPKFGGDQYSHVPIRSGGPMRKKWFQVTLSHPQRIPSKNWSKRACYTLSLQCTVKVSMNL